MKLAIATTAALLLTAGVTAPSAHADPTFASDVQSRLARHKARQKLAWSKLSDDERAQRLTRRARPGAHAGGETPCGAIDLANVDNATISGGTRAVTVIIDGDVINANNNCR